jgi:inner membrane protein
LNGTAHLTIGAATGFAVAYSLQTGPTTTMIFVGLGGISGLLPDIDIDGKLSNKITFSHKLVRSLVQTIGVLLILFSFLTQADIGRWIGIGIGFALIFLSTFIKQRLMLTITGIGIVAIGLYFKENWTILLGIYTIIASFIPHRSYTHSFVGVIFFGVIAHLFEARIGIHGVFMTCVLGYISHLIADMKILPFNKRGVKWFLPFWKKEF